MSIRSIGKFLSCLEHSHRSTRRLPVLVSASPSTWLIYPSRCFSSHLNPRLNNDSSINADRTLSPTTPSPRHLSGTSDHAGNGHGRATAKPIVPPTRPVFPATPRQQRRHGAWRIRLRQHESAPEIYTVGSDPTPKELERDRFRTPTGPAFRVNHSQTTEVQTKAFTVFLDHSLSRRFVPRIRRVDSVPAQHRITERQPSLHRRARKRDWDHQFGELAFPKDGDIEEAQRRFSVFHSEAEKLLRLSQSLSGNASLMSPRYLTKHLVPLVIGALAHSAKYALDIMLLLQHLTTFRLNMRCDCLLYISKVYKPTLETEPAIREMFDQQIEMVAEPGRWPNKMPKNVLLAILHHSSPYKRQEIIDSVFARYDPVPLPLRLAMMDHYIYHKEPKKALEVLSRLSPEELEAATPSLHDRFYNLLKIDTVESSSTGLNFQILPALVATGIPFDDALHNVVLERAVTLGLPDVAWEVYRFMEGNKITVDARRHLVLLRSCFQRSDLEGLNRIMSSIHQSPDLVRDRFLISYTMNIVRYVCYFERKLPVTESLAHILAVYDRVYDRTPLVKLAIVESLPTSETRLTLKRPDGLQLGFTLWTYVLVQRSDRQISHLWLRFIHLVNMGDPEMRAVAAHDVFYNGLITYWGRNAETLINAVETLEEMERLNLCEPTELTWVLLVSAFTRHGQKTAAENIRQMMKARGVNPDISRWRFLLDHYPESELAARIEADFDAKEIPSGLPATKPPKDGGPAS